MDENNFDPNVNYEDAEFLEHAKKTLKAAQYLQQQQNQQYNEKFLNDSWTAALEAEGIDAATYNQLIAEDPNLVREAVGDHMRNLVRTVKRGRDSRGRYTKPETTHGKSVQQRRESQPPDSRETLDRLREKSKGQHLDSQDEIDIITALFPNIL